MLHCRVANLTRSSLHMSKKLFSFAAMKINIEYWKIGKILPYAQNARTHSESQVQDIVRSISEFGFVNPCIVDEEGNLISGHGRVMAANELGMKDVPVVRLSHLNKDQVKALRLADNRISLSSHWDFEKLADELSALAETNFDLSVTGFDSQELEALLSNANSILPHIPIEGGEGRGIPNNNNDELQRVQPKSSDDKHSTFEIIMVHTNKIQLVEVLDKVRQENALPKIEDALMLILNYYVENEIEE